MAMQGYGSASSVPQGGEIDLHVGGVEARPPFGVGVVLEPGGTTVRSIGRRGYVPSTTPSDAYAEGCHWPSAETLRIPLDWRSGLYRFSFAGVTPDPNPVRFVVKARTPGSSSSILVMLPSNTYQAYNCWGGRNLYDGLCDGLSERSRRVSFDRPTLRGSDLGRWELGFIGWLDREGIRVEYCVSEDVHADASLLGHYRLLVSVGHDEYWSKEMRDNVEAFIAAGGNVAFLSGNVCWWQVRYEHGTRQMVCYKDAAEDPFSGADDARVTVNWRECPVRRPENHLTGVSFAHGAGAWMGDYSGTAYTVKAADHWVFAGTDLRNEDPFGGRESVVGYETDAAEYFDDAGTLRARGGDGSPSGFRVLATADLSHWAPWGWSAGPVGTRGQATMGIFRGGRAGRGGVVFTAATTGWIGAIGNEDVAQITRNVLRRLSWRRRTPDRSRPAFTERAWEEIGHARQVTAMAATNRKLFASTRDNSLWWRDPVGWDVPWDPIGHANHVRAMAAVNGKLFAATTDNTLWWRDPVGRDVTWERIGHAENVCAMAAINDKLWAATAENVLWWRDPVGRDVNWDVVGHANEVRAMAAVNGKLFAATMDNALWWRDPVGRDVDWERIGHANGVLAMTALCGKLYAADSSGRLWQRDGTR